MAQDRGDLLLRLLFLFRKFRKCQKGWMRRYQFQPQSQRVEAEKSIWILTIDPFLCVQVSSFNPRRGQDIIFQAYIHFSRYLYNSNNDLLFPCIGHFDNAFIYYVLYSIQPKYDVDMDSPIKKMRPKSFDSLPTVIQKRSRTRSSCCGSGGYKPD